MSLWLGTYKILLVKWGGVGANLRPDKASALSGAGMLPWKVSKSEVGGKPVARKGSVDEGEVTSPGRKGRLFSKILRKK